MQYNFLLITIYLQIQMEGYKSLEEKATVEYEIEVDEKTGKERAKNVVVVEVPAKAE